MRTKKKEDLEQAKSIEFKKALDFILDYAKKDGFNVPKIAK